MTNAWAWVVAIPVAYLLGAIPSGILAARAARGIDIRTYGSGSSGATNVARTLGWPAALPVLALDLGKGLAAVALAKLIADSTVIEAVAASMVMVGHNWPVTARFRGGKGVATGLGALALISPFAAAAALTGPLTAGLTRYVSLGSLVGTASACLVLLVQLLVLDYADPGYLIFLAFGMGLIFARHRPNVMRLLRGEENKIGVRPTVKRATLARQ